MSKENDFAAQFKILTDWADLRQRLHQRDQKRNLSIIKRNNKEAEEVIEGLLAALSHFEYLPNQYKHVLPAIEKAQKFLGK